MLKVGKKIILNWENVGSLVHKICATILKDYPNIDSIHGIKRGGLIPSVMISHQLGLPWTYEILPNTLVVDDICDSGETLHNYAGVFPCHSMQFVGFLHNCRGELLVLIAKFGRRLAGTLPYHSVEFA